MGVVGVGWVWGFGVGRQLTGEGRGSAWGWPDKAHCWGQSNKEGSRLTMMIFFVTFWCFSTISIDILTPRKRDSSFCSYWHHARIQVVRSRLAAFCAPQKIQQNLQIFATKNAHLQIFLTKNAHLQIFLTKNAHLHIFATKARICSFLPQKNAYLQIFGTKTLYLQIFETKTTYL